MDNRCAYCGCVIHLGDSRVTVKDKIFCDISCRAAFNNEDLGIIRTDAPIGSIFNKGFRIFTGYGSETTRLT